MNKILNNNTDDQFIDVKLQLSNDMFDTYIMNCLEKINKKFQITNKVILIKIKKKIKKI